MTDILMQVVSAPENWHSRAISHKQACCAAGGICRWWRFSIRACKSHKRCCKPGLGCVGLLVLCNRLSDGDEQLMMLYACNNIPRSQATVYVEFFLHQNRQDRCQCCAAEEQVKSHVTDPSNEPHNMCLVLKRGSLDCCLPLFAQLMGSS